MNRRWRDKDEQIHEDTDWISVVLWNSENLAEFLTRGKQVYVEGRLQTRSYEDREGVKRYVTEVVAQNVVLLGGGENGNGATEKPKSRQSARTSNQVSSSVRSEPDLPEMVDDSVPF
jgi:single-strand DNA-binding protein